MHHLTSERWSQVNRYVSVLLLLAASTLVGGEMAAPVNAKRTSRDFVTRPRGVDVIAAKLLQRGAASAPVMDVDTVAALGHAVLVSSTCLQLSPLIVLVLQVVPEHAGKSLLEQTSHAEREVVGMLQGTSKENPDCCAVTDYHNCCSVGCGDWLKDKFCVNCCGAGCLLWLDKGCSTG
jgi:hypothetical protein